MSLPPVETKFATANQNQIDYAKRIPLYEKFAAELNRELVEALSTTIHVDRISVRVKTAASFAKKCAKYAHPFLEIEDQVAARVLVFFLTDIEDSFREPKSNEEFGYESQHIVCIIPPNLKPNGWTAAYPSTFELQIRTLLMHAWAEPQHDLAYKSPVALDGDTKRRLAWVAASCWGADQEYERIRAKFGHLGGPSES
jgi:putative GTP pyrophosphokinase